MRTKRMVILFSLVVLAIVFAMTLCSCSLLNGGDGGSGNGSGNTTNTGNDGSGTGETPDADVGWKKVDNADIYNSLILGCTNVAYQGSKTAVSKKGVLTMESKINLTLNGNDLWLLIKGKYKSSDPRNNTIVTIDVSTTEEPTAESRTLEIV